MNRYEHKRWKAYHRLPGQNLKIRDMENAQSVESKSCQSQERPVEMEEKNTLTSVNVERPVRITLIGMYNDGNPMQVDGPLL